MPPLIRLEARDQGGTVGPTAACKAFRGLLPTIIQLDVGACRTAPHRPVRRVDHPDPVTWRMCASSPDHHGTAYNDFERQTAAATGCGLTSRQDLTTKASGFTTAPSGWTWHDGYQKQSPYRRT